MEQSTLSPPLAAHSSESERKISPQLQDARDFIQTLTKWRENNRGRLAQLKRNVGEPFPGRGVSWFYQTLYEGNSGLRLHRGDEYFLVATLFDLNRFPTERGDNHSTSFGASMRRAVAGGANEESTGRRLQILLDADFEEGAASELAFRLRQTVQWLNGQKVGVDYARLLHDLCRWKPNPEYVAKYGDKPVQKKWAQDFYNVRLFDAEPAS